MEESDFADLILIFYTFIFYVSVFYASVFYILVLLEIINYCLVNRRHF